MRSAGRRLLDPVTGLLARAGVNPSAITLTGLAVTAAAAWMAWMGQYLAAAGILAAGSLLDALDGGVARRRGMVSRAGAVLDSSCDRIGEMMIFGALLAGAAGRVLPSLVYLAPAALGGSYMVSYVRARSEGVGIPCTVGIFTRTERMILLVAALAAATLAGDARMIAWMMAVVAAGTWATAAHRLIRVFSEDRQSQRAQG